MVRQPRPAQWTRANSGRTSPLAIRIGKSLRQCTKRTITFELASTPNTRFISFCKSGALPMTIDLGETLFDPNGVPVTQLPTNLQAEVDKASETARNLPVTPTKRDVIPPL